MTTPTTPVLRPPAPTPEYIARRLGVDDPSEELLDLAQDAIDDAIGDVEGYLGRAITPVQRTATRCWPVPGGWDIPGEQQPIRRIISATEELVPGEATIPAGTFTVVYEVGLDYVTDPELSPIRRYLNAAALNNYMLLQYVENRLGIRGPVNSVSVSTEGQSKNVTYGHLGYTPPASRGSQSMDAPGQLPKLTSLDRWKLANRRVHQAPTQRDPWYRERAGMGGGWYGAQDWADRQNGEAVWDDGGGYAGSW